MPNAHSFINIEAIVILVANKPVKDCEVNSMTKVIRRCCVQKYERDFIDKKYRKTSYKA